MKFDKLKETWSNIHTENSLHRVANVSLAIALAMLVFAFIFIDRQTVVMVPPEINEETEITHNQASASYKKSLGLYLASLIGNVHPGNTEFIMDTLDGLLAPSVYRDVKHEIMDQIDEIQIEDISITFEAQGVDYWPDTDRIVIYGNSIMRGRGDETDRTRMVYEFEVDVSGYMPQFTYINTYEGRPERQD